MLIKHISRADYENVVCTADPQSGLKAIIAIHDTTLGPALGGTRMWPYDSEEDALADVLRLAKGMTFKAAAAGLSLGGGKAVIIGNSQRDKSVQLLEAYGRLVDSLRGQYITAEDVGTTQADMDVIHKETRYVVGISGGSGDPSPATAYGVYLGIKTAAGAVFGTEDLKGKVIAVQGVGSVGYHLCRYLQQEGAKLIVTDIDPKKINQAQKDFHAKAVAPGEIAGTKCHIFAPCALGGIINDRTIPRLKCPVIAGSANNVLAEARHGNQLHQMGILYIPDYVINAGGLINVAEELTGYDPQKAKEKIEQIPKTISKILKLSKQQRVPPSQAADLVALERLGKKAPERAAVKRG